MTARRIRRMGDSLGMSGGSLAHSVEVCPVPRSSYIDRDACIDTEPEALDSGHII